MTRTVSVQDDSSVPLDVDTSKVSFQNFADDTNLDGFDGNEVRTRSVKYTWQVWSVEHVGTHQGEKVYTITMAGESGALKGKNLEATTAGGKVKLATAEAGKLSQRWILRLQDDQTAIQSMKFKDYVLTGKGEDAAVRLEPNQPNGDDAQKWTPYNKAAA